MVKSSKEKRLLVLRLGTFVLKLGTDVGCQKVSRMIPLGKKRVAPIVLVWILTVRDGGYRYDICIYRDIDILTRQQLRGLGATHTPATPRRAKPIPPSSSSQCFLPIRPDRSSNRMNGELLSFVDQEQSNKLYCTSHLD